MHQIEGTYKLSGSQGQFGPVLDPHSFTQLTDPIKGGHAAGGAVPFWIVDEVRRPVEVALILPYLDRIGTEVG